MRISGVNFAITRIIVHEVPKSIDGSAVAKLSAAESQLTREVKEFFERRTIIALNESGFDARVDSSSTSPIPQDAEKYVRSGKKFVETSHSAANHLVACQKGKVSSGLLTVAGCKIKQQNGLVFIKLEKDEGVRVTEKKTAGGKIILNVDHVRNLMLTDRVKIFKVALFLLGGRTGLKVRVCDYQQPRMSDRHVAQFFLSTFLGCELLEKSDVLTQKYLLQADKFSNEHLSDPIARAQFHTALIADLASNKVSLDASTFAKEHLPVALRNQFTKSVEDAGIPTNPFRKDTTLVQQYLAKMQMVFDKDLSLIGPPSSFEDYVDRTESGVVVTADVKRVGVKR